MQFAIAVAALVGTAAAVPHSHSHTQLHKKSILSEIKEAIENTATSWVATSAPTEGNYVVNTFMNQADEDVTLYIWGNAGSWVNAVSPFVSETIKAGENLTVTHAIGSAENPNIGGWAAVYSDTKLVNGQISNMWGEFNFLDSEWGSSTYDVSQEPNMDGHNMSIQGPKCTSSSVTNQCVFKCTNGQTICGDAGTYELVNCAANSQEGASAGTYGGAASGGCQGIPNTGITNLYTTLH